MPVVRSNAKCYCFTINNPTQAEHDDLEDIVACGEARFCIFKYEIGEGGTSHIQGYVQWRKKKRITGIKKLNGFERAHLECAKGSLAQNVSYVSKAETTDPARPTIYTFGEGVKGGQRTDIEAACALIKDGGSMKDVAEAHAGTFVKFHKGFVAFQDTFMGARDITVPPKVLVLWGPTGTGNTRTVYECFGTANVFPKPPTTKWWDGYRQERVVLIDDFQGYREGKCAIPYDEMLRLLDRYPMRVERKGSSVQVNSEWIVITSNQPPEDWYPGDNSALMRRIDEGVGSFNVANDADVETVKVEINDA